MKECLRGDEGGRLKEKRSSVGNFLCPQTGEQFDFEPCGKKESGPGTHGESGREWLIHIKAHRSISIWIGLKVCRYSESRTTCRTVVYRWPWLHYSSREVSQTIRNLQMIGPDLFAVGFRLSLTMGSCHHPGHLRLEALRAHVNTLIPFGSSSKSHLIYTSQTRREIAHLDTQLRS